MNYVLGIDVSTSRVKRNWFRQHPQVRVFIQNLWPGGWGWATELERVAQANLIDALEEGLYVAAYIVVTPDRPSPWYAGSDMFSVAYEAAQKRAGEAWKHLRSLWVDIETLEHKGVTYWPSAGESWRWVRGLMGEGHIVGVYTGSWFHWQYGEGGRPYFGTEWASLPLWVAAYQASPQPNLNVYWQSIPVITQAYFPPWLSAVGHQYGGGDWGGVNCDYNVFDLDALEGGERMEKVYAYWLSNWEWVLRAETVAKTVEGITKGEVFVPVQWGDKVPFWLGKPPQPVTLQQVLEAAYWFLEKERPELLERLATLEKEYNTILQRLQALEEKSTGCRCQG